MDDIDDLDNLDDIDDLDNLDIESKILNTENIENTNTEQLDINPVLFNDKKNNLDTNTTINTTETIELDKLLSGDNEITTSNETKNYKIEDLQTMTIKQLKDLAKLNKIKSVGNKTKLELIETLTKNLSE